MRELNNNRFQPGIQHKEQECGSKDSRGNCARIGFRNYRCVGSLVGRRTTIVTSWLAPRIGERKRGNEEVGNRNESYTTIFTNGFGIFSSIGYFISLGMFVSLLFQCFCGINSPFRFFLFWGCMHVCLSLFFSYGWMGSSVAFR